MIMDELKLSEGALVSTIEIIKKYVEKQKALVDDYEKDIKNLSDDWEGSQFDSISDFVNEISERLSDNMDAIKERYPKYLDEKINVFRARPTFSNNACASSKSNDYSPKTDSGSKNPKTIYEKLFERHNKDLIRGLYFYLMRINFYVSNEKTSFYDPDGLYKRGLYKNIMAIDLNSPNCESDLLFLTGQHIYFQMKHDWQMRLIRCVASEINNKAFIDDAKFRELSNKIVNGAEINDKYLHFKDNNAKVAFHFFTFAFNDFIAEKNDSLGDYEKYFSHSYDQFRELLNHIKG